MAKGQTREGLGVIVGIAISLVFLVLMIHIFITSDDALLVRAGYITNETARSIAKFMPLQSQEKSPVQKLEAPKNIKDTYNTLKNTLEVYQKSKDVDCIITIDSAPLEKGHSIVMKQLTNNMEFSLMQARSVLIETKPISGLKVCSVFPENYFNPNLDPKVAPVYLMNRVDIENLGSAPNVAFDADFDDQNKYTMLSDHNQFIFYKWADEYICPVVFTTGINWIRDYKDQYSFYRKHGPEFFNQGSPYYRPKCRAKLPEYKFETDFPLADGTLRVTTKLYSRAELNQQQKDSLKPLVEGFYKNTYFQKTKPSEAVKKNAIDLSKELKEQLRTTVYLAAVINLDVEAGVVKKTT
ncbi:hypothetical protein KY328_00460 [Candidatus Woesearchaeota archaeon]|nr:hypothetical protein [Candidatus Woesearchaeota archaeon]MBW3021368.1 hypothetical protein [Candidatus Woesearchaeota archaeon]